MQESGYARLLMQISHDPANRSGDFIVVLSVCMQTLQQSDSRYKGTPTVSGLVHFSFRYRQAGIQQQLPLHPEEVYFQCCMHV